MLFQAGVSHSLYNTITTSSHMIITQHVTWKRSDWHVRTAESASPRSIHQTLFLARGWGLGTRLYTISLHLSVMSVCDVT